MDQRSLAFNFYKKFSKNIFTSKPLPTQAFGILEPSSEQVKNGGMNAELIDECWGGVTPNFISKTISPNFQDYSFTFYNGMPSKVFSYENVLYHPQYHCLYSSDGNRIDHSSYWTRLYQTPAKIEVPNNISKINDEFIYIGDYTANMHYGHFLIEAIAPLYYLLDDKQTKVLCNEVTRPFKTTFVDIFFKLANFQNSFYSFPGVVQISKVIVPSPSLYFGAAAYSSHKLVPERVATNLLASNKTTQQPVYLSRTRLNKTRRIYNEDVLEAMLSKAGVLIVHPEYLSLSQQIELINKHEVIIGCSGSALHTILFDILKNKRLIVLEDEDKIDVNFLIVDAIKSLSTTYITALQQERASDHSSNRSVNRKLDISFLQSSLKELGILK